MTKKISIVVMTMVLLFSLGVGSFAAIETIKYDDGSIYVGEFLEDQLSGEGSFTSADGTIKQQRSFINSKFQSEETAINPNKQANTTSLIDQRSTNLGYFLGRTLSDGVLLLLLYIALTTVQKYNKKRLIKRKLKSDIKSEE